MAILHYYGRYDKNKLSIVMEIFFQVMYKKIVESKIFFCATLSLKALVAKTLSFILCSYCH